MNTIPKINHDLILIELIKSQLKNIPSDKRLSYDDLKRISKFLNKTIFNNECSLWTGNVTIIKNDIKNTYINFYYTGKKHSIHRLLYNNFIGELSDSEYIKFKCKNKGRCCNINHFYVNDKNNNPIKSTIELKTDSNPDTTQETHLTNIKPIMVNFNI